MEPKDPIRHQKDITLVFADAAGATRRQTTHVHNQTAADLLSFLNFPADGKRIVTGRAGQAIGLDEKIYDHVDSGKEVHIKMHPEARHGGPGIFPVNPVTGLPVAFDPVAKAPAAKAETPAVTDEPLAAPDANEPIAEPAADPAKPAA